MDKVDQLLKGSDSVTKSRPKNEIQNKKKDETVIDARSMAVDRLTPNARLTEQEELALIQQRRPSFRNAYNTRHVAHLPDHRKKPNRYYVFVTQEKVGQFLDMGYLIDQDNNGSISDEMIGRANLTGTVPNFGIGPERMIVMWIPQEMADEREAAYREQNRKREASFRAGAVHKMKGDLDTDVKVTGTKEGVIY